MLSKHWVKAHVAELFWKKTNLSPQMAHLTRTNTAVFLLRYPHSFWLKAAWKSPCFSLLTVDSLGCDNRIKEAFKISLKIPWGPLYFIVAINT